MSSYLYDKVLECIGREWYGAGDDGKAAKAVLDARIARAEAAEAYADWMIDNADPVSITLEKYGEGERLCRAYVAAREAVRKLEGQADGP